MRHGVAGAGITPHPAPPYMKTIPPIPPQTSGFSTRIFRASAFFLLCVLGPFAVAQSTGAISGRIYNEVTGAFLAGAEVTVAGSSLRTVTDRDGTFSITGVPSGQQTISVAYAGLDSLTKTVGVRSGETALVDGPMTAGIYKLEAFAVSAWREGNSAAIARQKAADAIMNVISMDAFGNVPDGNVGQFMKRLPGVHVMTAEGEIIAIGLRGAPPALSMVTMDGAKMPAASGGSNQSTSGDRAPSVDRLPAEFIKEIEINKASLPDKAVDGLGGSANLVTKSAFDFKERVVNYRTGLNYNTYRTDQRKYTPNYAVTYMDTVMERKVGLTLNASYTKNQSSRDRLQAERVFADGRNTLVRFLDDGYMTTRYGVKGRVEYRPTAETSIGIDTNYTNYFRNYNRYQYRTNDFGGRRTIDFGRKSRADIIAAARIGDAAGATPFDSNGNPASVVPGFTDNRTELLNQAWTTQGSDEQRWGDSHKIGVYGSTKIGEWKITGQGSANPNKFINYASDNNVVMPFGLVGIVIDGSNNLDRPVLTQTAGPSIFRKDGFDKDSARLDMSRFYSTNQENLKHAQLDAQRDFATRYPFTLKAGLAWTSQHRNTYVTNPAYRFVGADGIWGPTAPGRSDDGTVIASIMQPTGTSAGGYGMFNGIYDKFNQVDVGKVKALWDNDRVHSQWVYTGAAVFDPPKLITEEVQAAYVMGKMQVAKLQIVTGARGESTDVASTGRFTDRTNPTRLQTVDREKNYKKFFPSIHFRYQVTPEFLLRASYSTSMARPAISQLIADTVIDPSAQTINQNNPGLLPTTSQSYDLSAEYYFKNSGLLTVGVFRKDLKDFIWTDSKFLGTGADNGFNGQYVGWQYNTQRNAGTAKIDGQEINYMQRLEFLPRPFNTLTLHANYTHLKTSGNYGYGIGASVGGALIDALPNFMPKTFNVGFSYDFRGFQLRVQSRYQDDFLAGYAANPLSRTYNESFWNTDASVSYKIRKELNLFCDCTNITNRWPSWYNGGASSRVFISEVYGMRLSFGVMGRF